MTDRPLISLDAALALILDGATALPAETVALADALGRVLAVDTRSRMTLPPWDNSAMDGFAVRSADVRAANAANPVRLSVAGEVAAGHAPDVTVGPGTAVRILTGGMLPAGADAIVPVEDTDAPHGVAALPDAVSIRDAASAGQHIRTAGSDIISGEALLAAGTRISAAGIAALAATGHVTVEVHRRPRVAIIATGDELVPVGEALGPASIPDSNSESVSAQATMSGAEIIRFGIARDGHDAVRGLFAQAIESADVLVSTGGVSVGAHDVVKDVFEELGTLELWRVAVQPGKPLAYGHASRRDGGSCTFFGLPGNPVSSFVTFELFVRPLLRRLGGASDPRGRLVTRATLVEAVRKSPGRRAFIRVRLEAEEGTQDRYRARMAGGQGSHVLSALAHADGLAVIPEDVSEQPAGTEVEVIRLDVEIV